MLYRYLKLLFIAKLFLVHSSKPYNILAILDYPGQSHYDAFRSLFKTLAERGHNITILTQAQVEKMKHIKYVFFTDDQPTSQVFALENTGEHRFFAYYSMPKLLSDLASNNCRKGLRSLNFQKFLHTDGHYDLIIVEMFNTNCFYGLITKYNVPFIGLSSANLLCWQEKWFGIPSNTAYIQNIFGGFRTPMSFLSRVENTLLQLSTNAWYKLKMEIPGRDLSKKYIGYDVPEPHHASLILVNDHYTLDGVKPLTPSVVEVGGIHINNKKPKELPKDIENWINNSDEGVIYFSLGSMVRGDTFPEMQRQAFASAFAKLPERILWKWENDTMPDKPENIMTVPWMPQFDILSHPNVKLFMSHGGKLGMIEAVHCGVPMIVLPQFGDQRHNAHAVENNGIGVILHLQSATEEVITKAIQKALDPKILRNTKALSEKFKDRPLSPMDTAVYWIEHVARHKGAQHMKSPAVDMPFYQYLLLDVIAFIILIILMLSYVVYKSFRFGLGLLIYYSKRDKQKLL